MSRTVPKRRGAGAGGLAVAVAMFAADVTNATFTPQITGIARSSSYMLIGRGFSDEEAQSIIDGKQYVYFMGRLTYYDNAGKLRSLDYCAVKFPFFKDIPLCKGHNGP